VVKVAVVDSSTQNAAVGVFVRLCDSAHICRDAVSDGDGIAFFFLVADGVYDVTAGYFRAGASSVTVADGVPSADPVPVVLPRWASVSGTVVSGVTGLPVAGAYGLLQWSNGYMEGLTDASGHFSFANVPDGDWQVLFSPPDGADLQHAKQGVHVVGAADVVASVTLARGNHISGTVVDSASGAALGGLKVYARSPGVDFYATTDAVGRFSMTGVDDGTYDIVWDGNVVLRAGVSVGGGNGAPLGGLQTDIPSDLAALTGRVTQAGSGSPVAGAALRIQGATQEFSRDVDYSGRPMATDTLGRYAFVVGWSGQATADVAAELASSGLIGAAAGVTIVPGVVNHVDVSVSGGGSVSGRVVLGSTTPAVGASVQLCQTASGVDCAHFSCAPDGPGCIDGGVTDANGGYRVAPLRGGLYTVRVVPAGDDRPFFQTAVSPVTVATGADVTLDLAIKPKLVVSGTVAAPSSAAGASTEGVGVRATEVTTGILTFASTDAFGRYSMALDAGTYHFLFLPPRGVLIATEGPTVAVGGTDSPDVSVVLAKGGSLAGAITFGGQPYDGVVGVRAFCVDPTTLLPCPGGFSLSSFAVGSFSLVGLPDGLYRLTARAGALFAGRYERVINGGDLPSRDLELMKQGSVSGVITAHGGAPPGVGVRACQTGFGCRLTGTDSTGAYRLGPLGDGTWELSFTPTDPSFMLPDPITVSIVNGADMVGYDVALTKGTTVSGTLHDTAGAGIAGANVQLCGLDRCRAGVTDGAGRYSLSGLRAGAYEITVFPPAF
jgi:hypothetical protein